MQENTLLKITLLTALLGITILFFISNSYNDTSVDKVDGYTVMKGEVKEVKSGEKYSEIILLTEKKVRVFDKIDVTIGQNIAVYGKPDEEGITADKIVITQK